MSVDGARVALALRGFLFLICLGPPERPPALGGVLLMLRSLFRLAGVAEVDEVGCHCGHMPRDCPMLAYPGPIMFSGRTSASNSSPVT